MENTNKIEIIGNVVAVPVLDHEVYGEKFYSLNVKTKRLSDTEDILPVLISERIIDINNLKEDTRVKIVGQLRSHNNINENKVRLILNIFVKEIEIINDEINIFLTNIFSANINNLLDDTQANNDKTYSSNKIENDFTKQSEI